MEELKEQLRMWAREYNTPDFIANDPIQIPHKYKSSPKDAEISGLVTSWISYGNRRSIIARAKYIDTEIFQERPLDYIASEQWKEFRGNQEKIYRFYSYDDFSKLCETLYSIYYENYSLEHVVNHGNNTPINNLIATFGHINGIPFQNFSACKRLNMFLRWMVRDDDIVDLGIWQSIDPNDLIIPLDVHVHRIALELGITKRTIVNMKTAMEITDYMRCVFPNDPCLGDFALFGYDINR